MFIAVAFYITLTYGWKCLCQRFNWKITTTPQACHYVNHSFLLRGSVNLAHL